MSRRLLASVICVSVTTTLVSNAFAQDPEAAAGSGDSASASGGASASASLGGSSDSSASGSTSSGSSSDSSASASAPSGTVPVSSITGPNDHAAVAGKWGIGYLGFRSMLMGAAAVGGGTQTVDAPVVGVRYWMGPDMGLDLGLGLSFATGSTTTEANGNSTDTDNPEPFVAIVHGGIPLALASSRHLTFEITPELNIGYATNTTTPAMGNAGDIKSNGFHVDLGARAGAEIQFGFIDMPELALQAGIGVGLAIDHTKVSQGDNSASRSRTAFVTSSGENPWQIFSANLAALYYFGG
ncbi:MAG TPA: hypothetical protein VHM70_02305 [Polyangiaceae bacterium]|nr:hypothetical protein [Polyangiaceae bacterium]